MSRGYYRLAALDMDGTLLNTAHETTPFTRAALARAAEAGKVIALCTGRCMSELWPHLEVNPGIRYAICESGGCVYDVWQKKALRQATIDQALVGRILDMARAYDVCVQVFAQNQSYMELEDVERLRHYHIYDFLSVFTAGSVFVKDARAVWREAGGLEKINLYFSTEEQKRDFGGRMAGANAFLADSLSHGYEISPPEATKGLGLEALCRHLDIPVAETMAVGDGGNDLELMQAAGFSVAMANATEEIKAAADAFTDDCDHDGAAKAVLRWMLGERAWDTL